MSSATAARLLAQACEHHRAGRLAAAAAGYARVLALQPDHFDALQLSGNVALKQGRPAEAAARFSSALRVKPGAVACLALLGMARRELGQLDAAESALRQALALDPDCSDAAMVLAQILARIGRLPEAAGLFERVTRSRPASALAWVGLGSVLLQLGRAPGAVTCLTRALSIDPNHPQARYYRAQAYQQTHDTAAALADYDAQLARDPAHAGAHSFRLFLLHYRDDLTPGQLSAEHLRFGRLFPRAPAARPAAAPLPGGRLRVGFLSPDFRQHAVASFISPLLRHLDRNAFDVFLYHDHCIVDDVTRRLQSLPVHWRNLAGMNDDAVEPLIRGDGLDVLVDLAGHTGFNRLPLYARRLAPAQVTYLGYPDTTGLAEMDWRLTDAFADPPGASDGLHTETLVRFAPTAWCYEPPAAAPAVSPGPAARGGPVTFGSFNNLSKLNDATLLLWRRLLDRVPRSRLLLKGLRLDESALRARLARLGFDPGRIVLSPPRPSVVDHLDAYRDIDIALDPFPYNGTTTTCEALWMGVPVVTLAGDRHAARVGVSLLNAVGCPDWIAATPDDYLAIAAGLADGASGIDRASLRAGMRASPLLDHAGQARRLGLALRRCAQACRSQLAAISVPNDTDGSSET